MPILFRRTELETPLMRPGSIRVLITGGSRGLGRAMAEWLAARGAAVGLIARTADDLHATVMAIEEAGGRACALTCDVRDRTRLETTVTKIANTLGGLDVLVCAAGQLRGLGPMAVQDADLWWGDVETAVRAPRTRFAQFSPGSASLPRRPSRSWSGPATRVRSPSPPDMDAPRPRWSVSSNRSARNWPPRMSSSSR